MTNSNQRARNRGRDNEVRTAEILGGYVYTGKPGDVVVGDWIVECKYRFSLRLDTTSTLKDWVAQAKENAAAWAKKKQPKKWLIELYGGPGTERLGILPLLQLKELMDAYSELQALRAQGGHPAEPGGAGPRTRVSRLPGGQVRIAPVVPDRDDGGV